MKQFFLSTLLMTFVFGVTLGQIRYYNTYNDLTPLNNENYPQSVNYELLENGNSIIAGIRLFALPDIYGLDVKQIDEVGNIVWNKMISLGNEFSTNDSERFQVADILQDQGNFIIALNKKLKAINGQEQGLMSYILKINKDGDNVIWASTLTELDDNNQAYPGYLQVSELIMGKDGYAFVGTVGLVKEQPNSASLKNRIIYGELNFMNGLVTWEKLISSAVTGIQGLSIYYEEDEDRYYIGGRVINQSSTTAVNEAIVAKAIPNGVVEWTKIFKNIFVLAEPFGHLPIVDHHPLNNNTNQLAIVGQSLGHTDFIVIPFTSAGNTIYPSARFPLQLDNANYEVKSAEIVENNQRIACVLSDDVVERSVATVGKVQSLTFPAIQYDLNSPVNVDEGTVFQSIGSINNQINIGGYFISSTGENQYSIIKSDWFSNFTTCIDDDVFMGEVFPGENQLVIALNFPINSPIENIYSTTNGIFGPPVDFLNTKNVVCEQCAGTSASLEITENTEDCSYTLISTSTFECTEDAIFEWAVYNITSDIIYTNFSNFPLVTFNPTCDGPYTVCLRIIDCNGCISKACADFTVGCTDCPCTPSTDDCFLLTPDEEDITVIETEPNYEEGYNVLPPFIFPNPSNRIIHIQMETFLDQQSTIYLKDTNGKLIHTYKPNMGSSLYTIDMADHASGMYFITVEANGIQYPTQKVVIIK